MPRLIEFAEHAQNKDNGTMKTSWDGVAKWYNDLLHGEGTYQKELILPNLLRLLKIDQDIFQWQY